MLNYYYEEQLTFGSLAYFSSLTKWKTAKEYKSFIHFQIAIPCWDKRFSSVDGQIRVHLMLEEKHARQIQLFTEPK